MESLQDLLVDELKDVYSAEKQLTKALPKMARKASTPALRQAFESHLRETEGHIERLEKIRDELDIKLTGKTCEAMKGLIEEGKDVLEEDGHEAVLDAALIGAAQRVEHYEIAAYGTLRAIAMQLGYTKVAKLLEQTLKEEFAADEKLTKISEKQVLSEAPTGEEMEE